MFDWMHRGRIERPESEFRAEFIAIQKEKDKLAQQNLQQLRAEIAATMLPVIVALSKGDNVEIDKCIDKLQQLKG